KGVLNNKISGWFFKRLAENGVDNHLVEVVDDDHQLVKRVEIVKLEVIIRNIIAGSMAKRLGLEEGTEISEPIIEFSYKDDDLGDPLINRYHAQAIGVATKEEIDTIMAQAFKVNDLLSKWLDEANLILVDFKLEFGRTPDGKIILADEISPDTCRLWDKDTRKKLDKDRFRQDLGDVAEAYVEVWNRLQKLDQ
ncbi:MAG: phosphoribosylaminoimidazolesuccinocarboxamide synthase, partial [Peptococcus niger]